MMTIPIIKTVLVAVTITITITAVPVAPLDSFLSLEANDVVGRHTSLRGTVTVTIASIPKTSHYSNDPISI